MGTAVSGEFTDFEQEVTELTETGADNAVRVLATFLITFGGICSKNGASVIHLVLDESLELAGKS